MAKLKTGTSENRDREMAERIMALVGHGSFEGGEFGETTYIRVPEAFTGEFVVAGLAVVASEVQSAADRIMKHYTTET